MANSAQCALLTTDQLGAARPQPAGFVCDIGAVESARRPHNVTFQSTACYIVDAITAANTNAASGDCPAGSSTETDVITLTRDIDLVEDLPEITGDLTIDGVSGSEYDIDAGANTSNWEFSTGGRLIFRSSGSETDLTLRNLELKNARQTGTAVANRGGAIHHTGKSLTIHNVDFRGARSDELGGAIYTTSATTITDSFFTSLRAKRGGAIYFDISRGQQPQADDKRVKFQPHERERKRWRDLRQRRRWHEFGY